MRGKLIFLSQRLLRDVNESSSLCRLTAQDAEIRGPPCPHRALVKVLFSSGSRERRSCVDSRAWGQSLASSSGCIPRWIHQVSGVPLLACTNFSSILAFSVIQVVSLSPLARIAALIFGRATLLQIPGDGCWEVLSQPCVS